MENIRSVLTKQGKALFASLDGKTLKFTKGVCSKSIYNGNLEDLTEVTEYVKDLDIINSYSEDEQVVLCLRLNNRGVQVNTNIYQIGIYAKVDNGEEMLVQIIQAENPDTMLNQAYIWEKEYQIYCEIASSENFTIEITTPNYLSMINEHNTSNNSHQDIRKLIENLRNSSATNEDLNKLETSINTLEDELANVKSSLNDLAQVNYRSQIELEENINKLYNLDLNKAAHNVVLTIDVSSKSISSNIFNIGVIPEPCRPKKNVALNTLTSKGTMCYLFIDTDGKFGFRKESTSATWSSSETVRACINYIVD